MPILQSTTSALRLFAQAIMERWPHGDVDDGDLQGIAVKHGLLSMSAPKAPCDDLKCGCREYYDLDEFTKGLVECYRKTELLTVDPVVLDLTDPKRRGELLKVVGRGLNTLDKPPTWITALFYELQLEKQAEKVAG